MPPQDLNLLRKLREIPEANSLILQFGPYIGSTLAQVAVRNPEYIRELVNRTQRPELRAAPGKLEGVLEAAAEHKPRPAGRRNISNRAGPR